MIFCFIAIGAYSFYSYVIDWPNRTYKKVLANQYQGPWFIWEGDPKLYFSPKNKKFDEDIEISTDRFWQIFQFEDLEIPMPVKNPFYFVIPKLKYNESTLKTKFGLTFNDSKGENISEIYFFPKSSFPNLYGTQDLFTLPISRNILKLKSADQIWEDLFSKNLSKANIPWQEMVYHLYLLEFRKVILGDKFLDFGELVGTDLKYIDIDYPNKDYFAEIFLEKRGLEIRSFLLVSRKNSQAARELRKKMILEIDHRDTTESLADIYIKEFKALDYYQQIDHIGMIYLLAAWSHDKNRKEILEELIRYLERGTDNSKQLVPLYTYYFERYGKIYSQKYVPGLDLPAELEIKYKVKREENTKLKSDLESKTSFPAPEAAQSLESQFDKLIESSKVKKSRKSKSIRID